MGALRVRGGAPKQPGKKARTPHVCSRRVNLVRCLVCGGWYCYRCGKPMTLYEWNDHRAAGTRWRTHGALTYGCRCVLASRNGRTNNDFPDLLGDMFDYPDYWMIDGWM